METTAKYLALLRGINVGGKNIVKMGELVQLFESLHFTGVKTYIQSGNVLFNAPETDTAKLTKKIEKSLSNKLSSTISVAVLTFQKIKTIIDKKPKGFGDDNEHKYDVMYLIEPLKAADAIKEIKTRDDVDAIYTGEKVLYISRAVDNLTKSYFSKIIESPIYKSITIRNWNTTKKLFELMNHGSK